MYPHLVPNDATLACSMIYSASTFFCYKIVFAGDRHSQDTLSTTLSTTLTLRPSSNCRQLQFRISTTVGHTN